MPALSGLNDFLRDLSGIYSFEKNDTLSDIAVKAVKDSQTSANVPVEIGKLKQSFYFNPISNGVVFGYKAEHGVYSEFGTGIYFSPDMGSYWKYLDLKNGGFTKAVGRKTPWRYYHPYRQQFFTTSGQKPQYWFETQVEDVERRIKLEMQKALRRYFDDV